MSWSRRLSLMTILGAALLVPMSASASGLLIPNDQRLPPLALKHHRVDISVHDGTAVTTLEQVYKNSTGRMLEATYIFPVPKGAVVTEFQLMVNGKLKKGEVLEKGRANQIYSDIVRRMKDPGIVDWIDRDLFKARIFPVPANGEQKITITYTQVLPFLDGTYQLSYPLKTTSAAATTLEDFTLTVNLAHKVPIKTIYSPSHKISVAKKGEYKAVVGFEGDRVTLDKDFALYFSVSKRDVGLSLLTHRPAGEPGYFLLMASPKAVFDSDEIQGKAITFVLDTSGSMTGIKLEQAKRALKWCLDHLGDDDRFNVIRFSSDVEALGPKLVAASASNVAAAKRFVDDFEAAGGTAIDDALQAALKAEVNDETHLVVFLTDGRPTVGETDIKAILTRTGKANGDKARVFALGIGDDINTHLLDKLSGDNGGTSAYVTPSEDMDTHIAALYNQIAYPVLTDISLDMSKVRPFAAQPGALPDIFRGGQLLLAGRYRGDGDALIRLEGKIGKERRRFDFEATFPKETDDHAFIASLWAHRQVGFMLDQIRLNGETKALKDEVIQLAKKYGIVTPYTSYLVVEDQPFVGGPRPRPPIQPMPMPRPRPWLRGEGRLKSGGSPMAPAAEEAERDILDGFVSPTPSGAGSSGAPMKAASGKDAVSAAKSLRRLKDKETTQSTVTSVRYASGRVFKYRGDRGWLDDAIEGSLKKVEIKAYSDGWIALARQIPALKDALALGDHISIRVGSYLVVVSTDGKSSLDDKTLAALKKAASTR